MHYTTRVSHALHGTGLPCITRQVLYGIERCLGVLRHLPPWVVLGAGVVGDSDCTGVAVRSQDTPRRRAILLRNLTNLQHLFLDQNMDRHCQNMVCHALHDKVCHALHGSGLSCITRQGLAMYYPSRVCHALHDNGLLYITDQQVLCSTDSALDVARVWSDTYRLGSSLVLVLSVQVLLQVQGKALSSVTETLPSWR